MNMRADVIPLVDLKAAHAEVAQQVDEGLQRVLADGRYIKGPEVSAFEEEFAAYCGNAHCVAVANGTDAIEMALRAAELPSGSSVIVPANTFVATAEAVIRAGGRPVIVDVDPQFLLLDPVAAEKAVDGDVSGLVPVHLFGQLAPMAPVANLAARHGLQVIEDAAQAHGATQDGQPIGALSHAATTSFYPGKNLGAYGDAGAVVTNSADLAHRMRLLGDHGSERKYIHETMGFNSRMDAFQAVVLRAKLTRLADWNERRRQAAARYDDLLADLDDVVVPQTAPGNVHVWHLYVVQVPDRDRVVSALNESGVQAAIHYPVPLHLQPAFRSYGYAPGDFPVAEAAADRILSLPLYPHITPAQQERVVTALRAALA